jgi:outer membrane immunogenic protein
MIMKHFLIRIAFAATALVPVSGALAADVAPPPAPDDLRPATYDWSGPYAGAVGAAVFMNTKYQPSCGAACDPKLDADGFMGGGVLGWNTQIDNMVFGAEADWMWGSVKGSNSADLTKIDIDNIGTIRARMGYAMDDTLFYLTGGYAMAHANFEGDVGPAAGPFIHMSDKKWHSGWVAGAGVEHAFADGLSGRIEYLYANFGKETYDFTTGDPLNPGGTVDMGFNDVHTIRAGLTYNFGW